MQVPFFVRLKNMVLKKINPEEVICLHTEGNYTKIFLINDIYYLIRSTLSGALKKLPKDNFIRINRSTVVSIYFINQINKDQMIVDGVAIPISKEYFASALEKLTIIE